MLLKRGPTGRRPHPVENLRRSRGLVVSRMTSRSRMFESKQLDRYGVPGSRSEPGVARYQRRAESCSKHYVCRVIDQKIMAELPNVGQKHKVGIAREPTSRQSSKS